MTHHTCTRAHIQGYRGKERKRERQTAEREEKRESSLLVSQEELDQGVRFELHLIYIGCVILQDLTDRQVFSMTDRQVFSATDRQVFSVTDRSSV